MNRQLRRMILDFGPLLLFFTAYKLFDLHVATATIMAAAVTAVGIGYWLDRKIHPVPVFTAVIVLVFGPGVFSLDWLIAKKCCKSSGKSDKA